MLLIKNKLIYLHYCTYHSFTCVLIVVGIGIGYYIAYEVRRNRLLERLRVTWTWLQSEHDLPNKSTNNINLLAIEPTSLGDGASIRTIVSPDTAWTANMNTSLLTLGPGTELTRNKARGVEFYYVIQGTCTLSIQNKDDLMLAKGEFKVVDPWV
jgi:hypothetical protein